MLYRKYFVLIKGKYRDEGVFGCDIISAFPCLSFFKDFIMFKGQSAISEAINMTQNDPNVLFHHSLVVNVTDNPETWEANCQPGAELLQGGDSKSEFLYFPPTLIKTFPFEKKKKRKSIEKPIEKILQCHFWWWVKSAFKTFATVFGKQIEKDTGVPMTAIQCEELMPLSVIWGLF